MRPQGRSCLAGGQQLGASGGSSCFIRSNKLEQQRFYPVHSRTMAYRPSLSLQCAPIAHCVRHQCISVVVDGLSPCVPPGCMRRRSQECVCTLFISQLLLTTQKQYQKHRDVAKAAVLPQCGVLLNSLSGALQQQHCVCQML